MGCVKVDVNILGSPNSPFLTLLMISTVPGSQCSLYATMSLAPDFFDASMMAWQSSSVTSIGFSRSTW